MTISQQQIDQLSPQKLKSLINRGIIKITMTTKQLPKRLKRLPNSANTPISKGKRSVLAMLVENTTFHTRR